MYIFLPAWYQAKDYWHSPRQPHFERKSVGFFDQILSRLQMFYQAGEDSLLFLLDYAPHLRLTLNDKQISGIPYLSFFDWLQGFEAIGSYPVQLDEIRWPEGVNFIYEPYSFTVMKDDHLYANVYFSSQGTIIYVDFFQEGRLDKRLYLDDRGYFSMAETYEENHAILREYYNILGQIVMVQDLITGHCQLKNKALPANFSEHYDKIEAVLKDFLDYVMEEKFLPTDQIIIGAHPAHNELLVPYANHHHLIFSLSSESPLDLGAFEKQKIEKPLLFLVDRMSLKEKVETVSNTFKEANLAVQLVPPFDSRCTLGKSTQLGECIVNIMVDQMERATFLALLAQLKPMIESHPDFRFKFISFYQNSFFQQQIANWIDELQTKEQELNPLMPAKEQEIPVEWHDIMEEKDFYNLMSEARIVLDLAPEPNLYVQMASISVGIPQVTPVESEYLHHLLNGYVIKEITEVPTALTYYSEELDHWNQALIQNIKLIETYGSQRLIPYLKQLFEEYQS